MLPLKVPYGRNSDGSLVRPELAEKEKGRTYFCPACGKRIILKKGRKVRPHFSHGKALSCSQETIIHATAKALIVQAVNQHPREIVFARRCQCGRAMPPQKVPSRVTSAQAEVVVGAYRIDVGLLAGEEPVAGIEVRVAHEVDEAKKKALKLPFIEVGGDAVLSDPTQLHPLYDAFNLRRCQHCLQRKDRFRKLLALVSKQTKVPLPKYPFISGVQCWSGCDELTLVFLEDNVSDDLLNDPRECPKTLRRYSSRKNGGMGWHNHCGHCGYVQLNGRLFSLAGGAFSGFRTKSPRDIKDEEELYEILSFHADYHGYLRDISVE